MRFKMLTLATASLLAIAAAPSANAKPLFGDWGYNPSAMDSSVKPGDDFWAYVNGAWDKRTQIAADRASAGPFVTLSDQAEKDVHQIVEELGNNPNRDHLGQQVGDYYSSFMDTDAIEAAGIAPLKPYLAEINGVKSRDQLLSLFIKPGFASPVDVGIAPHFNWTATLAKGGLGHSTIIVVTEPSAVAGAGKILASTPLSTWKEWLAFRFVSDHASVLPKALDDARFAFYSKELSGVQQQRERWKRGVAAVNAALGEGVGEIYVKSHFPPSSEAQMHELISNLEDAYQERIGS